MSGEQDSVESRWAEFVKIAENYLHSLVISKMIVNSEEVQEALNLTRDQLNRLSIDGCLHFAYILDRHALKLQEEINKHSGKHQWAKHNLDVAIGNILKKGNWGTAYTKYEEKRMMVISDNTYCQALNQMVLESSTVIQFLDGLSYKVNTIAKTLKDLAYAKRKVE